MRSFDDTQGQRWQAALLEASYGDILLVFSPLQGGEPRQTVMPTPTLVDGTAALAELDDDGLRELLAESVPWDHQAGVERAQAAHGSPGRAAGFSLSRSKPD